MKEAAQLLADAGELRPDVDVGTAADLAVQRSIAVRQARPSARASGGLIERRGWALRIVPRSVSQGDVLGLPTRTGDGVAAVEVGL